MIIFQLKPRKFLYFCRHKHADFFTLSLLLPLKWDLNLMETAKFDAFHSNSLLALQVVSVSIVGYTTWEHTVYPRSDHLFSW